MLKTVVNSRRTSCGAKEDLAPRMRNSRRRIVKVNIHESESMLERVLEA